MRILFLHGWQSTPGGIKPTYLKDHGHEVLNPALPDDDFDAAVHVAEEEFYRYHPDVIVGSSRGGAVAMNMASGSTPLVLLGPAWKRRGTATTVKRGTVILHSRADEVVPLADSVGTGAAEPAALAVAAGRGQRPSAGRRRVAGAACWRRSRRSPLRRARAPFQFGIGMLLVVTAMYAVLFSLLRISRVPPSAFVVIALFVTAVGLGQRLLFHGQSPRIASMIAGASFGAVFSIICMAVFGVRIAERRDLVGGPFGGAIWGYLVGLLITGAFVLIRKSKTLRNRFGGREDPITTITTARLRAEAIAPSHFPDIHRLHTDPLVMKTLSADGRPLTEEATREGIRQGVDHWRQHGFGFWVFRRKTDGVFIGRGGLKVYQIDGKDVVGLAYAVMPDDWNQGFATEMARLSLDVGFGRLGLAEIASWTLPTNLASQRVMEKLGFRYERDFEFAGLLHRFYRLAAEEWRGIMGASGEKTPGLEEMP